MLRTKITVSFVKSRNSMPDLDPIFPQLIMAAGLLYLAGGKWQDIKVVIGISKLSFYHVRDMFLDAVNQTDRLAIQFPRMHEELLRTAAGFEVKSLHRIFKYCVGAIDGILIRIDQPTDVDNPRDYFSGHYQAMGLNIQAVCDANL